MVTKRLRVTTFRDGQNQGEVIDLGVHKLEIREIQIPPTGNMCISANILLASIGKTCEWAVVGDKAYLLRQDGTISIDPADKVYLNRHYDQGSMRIELDPGPPDKDGYYTGTYHGKRCKVHSTAYHGTEFAWL